MRIRELYLKNFGKFSEQHFYIQNGIQVIYGENEFGKSTLHAFIRAMFFGMERGRGRAAGKDASSRFEPWENPNYYAGVMRFECGGRNFRLERSFDRISKHASLICEDDGEELSVEDGDLDMLLGGITPSEFDSTVSVGQLMARPGQELSETLKNYAANYYETGGGEIDLNGALSDLRERRREVERDLKAEQQKQEEKRRSLAQECGYLERDMEKLKSEFEEKRSAAEKVEKREAAEQDEERRIAEQARRKNGYVSGRNVPGRNASGRNAGKQAGDIPSRKNFLPGVICLLIGILGLLGAQFVPGPGLGPGSVVLLVVRILSVPVLLAGAVLLTAGLRRKSGNAAGAEERVSDTGEAEEREPRLEMYRKQREQLRWELTRIRAEWKEKKIRLENLREEEEEFLRSDREKSLLRRREAILLAEEKIRSAAGKLGQQTSDFLNRRASEIFAELTEGKYRGIEADERLEITVWDGERRVRAEQLSRGTLEQIYFSIRMAAAELLQEEPMPVILDDTFVFYDDKRLESALKWLRRQERQVIIFTCQRREGEMLHEDRTAKEGIDDHQ